MAGEELHGRSIFHFNGVFLGKIFILGNKYISQKMSLNLNLPVKTKSKSNSHSLPTQKKNSKKILWFGLHFKKK